jgi:hypothetical protein
MSTLVADKNEAKNACIARDWAVLQEHKLLACRKKTGLHFKISVKIVFASFEVFLSDCTQNSSEEARSKKRALFWRPSADPV